MSQITDKQQMEATSQRAAAKLQAFHDGLTDDEQLVLDRAIRRFVSDEETDTRGYAVAVYEDAYGYKGRRGTGGESLPPQGSGPGGAIVPAVVLGAVFVLGAGTLPGSVGGEYPS